jgi:ABC-type sulfate transport system permease subunit
MLLPKGAVQSVPSIDPDAVAAVESTLLLGSTVVPLRSIWTVHLAGYVARVLDQHASSKGLGNTIKLAVKILRRADKCARFVKQLSRLALG